MKQALRKNMKDNFRLDLIDLKSNNNTFNNCFITHRFYADLIYFKIVIYESELK